MAMEAQVFKKDGKVLLMEAGADLAAALVEALRAPLGAVAAAAGGAGPVARLQETTEALREELFLSGKEATVASTWDLEAHFPAKGRGRQASAPDSHLLPPTLGGMIASSEAEEGVWSLTATAGEWASGAAFPCFDGDSFEVWVRQAPASSPMMLGVAPRAQATPSRLAEQNLHTRCGFYGLHIAGAPQLQLYGEDGTSHKGLGLSLPGGGSAFGLRFLGGARPALAFSADGETWLDAKFNSPIPSGVPMCPVVLLSGAGSACILDVRKLHSNRPAPAAVSLHPMVKFIITNDLQICESSSLRTVQLLKEHGSDMSTVEVQPAAVTPNCLRRLLAKALAGEREVLSATFAEVIAEEGGEVSAATT